MKIYQRLEQLLKFRIYSNSEIPEYLKRMSNMGKIDEVKKTALFNLILTVLGEMEDREAQLKETETFKVDAGPIPVPLNAENTPPPPNNPLKCPDCEMVAKSQLGLISHSRKHKKSV